MFLKRIKNFFIEKFITLFRDLYKFALVQFLGQIVQFYSEYVDLKIVLIQYSFTSL